jgi:cytochrome P450
LPVEADYDAFGHRKDVMERVLPVELPRAGDVDEFNGDILGFLARARAVLGDMFVVREGGPVFSRATGCPGAMAVFGVAGQRAVLSDIETFRLPVSAARQLSLPPRLVNLTCGLHTMRGEQHAAQKRVLSGLLGSGAARHADAVLAALEAFTALWRPGAEIDLLESMRRLALSLSCAVLFGDRSGDGMAIASMADAYFQLRREVSAPWAAAGAAGREALVAVGRPLDESLRRYIRLRRREGGAAPQSGVLARLACARIASGELLDEAAVLGHANVLLVSSTEPIAVALTWILLVLSQLPDLRVRIRRGVLDHTAGRLRRAPGRSARADLLESVIAECLRLLPPNAMMTRVTARPARLHDVSLPEGCEIILCPFVAHRDPRTFPQPTRFLPSRWRDARPSPSAYLAFGAGGHSCVGRFLARDLIKTALTFLLERFELVLAGDQEIDWRLHIQLMPRTSPKMLIQRARAPRRYDRGRAGRLLGPVGALLDWPERG